MAMYVLCVDLVVLLTVALLMLCLKLSVILPVSCVCLTSDRMY